MFAPASHSVIQFHFKRAALMIWLRFAILAAVGFGLWKFVRPKWAFTIVVDDSGVRSHQGISTPQQHRLLEMFQKTRFVEGRVKVCGRHDQNGQLELRFSGKLSDEARQQIRNFIVNEV